MDGKHSPKGLALLHKPGSLNLPEIADKDTPGCVAMHQYNLALQVQALQLLSASVANVYDLRFDPRFRGLRPGVYRCHCGRELVICGWPGGRGAAKQGQFYFGRGPLRFNKREFFLPDFIHSTGLEVFQEVVRRHLFIFCARLSAPEQITVITAEHGEMHNVTHVLLQILSPDILIAAARITVNC